jgi:hypothetical protein
VPHSQNTNIGKTTRIIQGITTYKIQNKKPEISKTATLAARNINANIAQLEIGHPQESKKGKEERGILQKATTMRHIPRRFLPFYL